MLSKHQLETLRHKRQYGLGRMLLLARKDFVDRLHVAMTHQVERLPPSAATLLPFIDLDGTRSTELAKRLGVTKQAVGKIIKELESSGLILRTQDESDARAFRVQFSEAGLSYMMRLHAAIDAVEAEYIKLLGKEQTKLLRQTLCKISYQTDLPCPE